MLTVNNLKYFLLFNLISLIGFGQDNLPLSDLHLQYIEEESKEIGVDQDLFYYVTKASDSGFMENIRASLFSFVKNNNSTPIDDMKLLKDGDELDFNSSCSVSEVTHELVLKNLNSDKTYNGLNLRHIQNQQKFKFPKDTLVGVIFYSKQLRYLIKPYLDKAKALREEHDLHFILVSLDTDKVKSIEDSYQNLPIGY